MQEFFFELKQKAKEQGFCCTNYTCYINEIKRKPCTMPDCCGKTANDVSIITEKFTAAEFEEAVTQKLAELEEFETVEEFLTFASTKEVIENLICTKDCHCECHKHETHHEIFKKTLNIYASTKKSGIYYIFLNNRFLNIYLHLSEDKTMIVPLCECIETYTQKLKKNQISKNLKAVDFNVLEKTMVVDTELPRGSFQFYQIQFSAMCIEDEPLKHSLIFGVNPESKEVWTCILAQDHDHNFIFEVPEDYDSKLNFMETFKSFSYFVFLCYLLRKTRGYDMNFSTLINLKNRCPGHDSRKEMIEMTTCMFKQAVCEAKDKSIVMWVKDLQEKRKNASPEHIEVFKKNLDEKLQKLCYTDTMYTGIQDIAMEKDFFQSKLMFSKSIDHVIQSNVSNALTSLLYKICHLRRLSKRNEVRSLSKLRKVAILKLKEFILKNDIEGIKKILSKIVIFLEDQGNAELLT